MHSREESIALRGWRGIVEGRARGPYLILRNGHENPPWHRGGRAGPRVGVRVGLSPRLPQRVSLAALEAPTRYLMVRLAEASSMKTTPVVATCGSICTVLKGQVFVV